MDPRAAKKAAEASRLRSVSAETTLRMGFQLMRFTRELAEAADRA